MSDHFGTLCIKGLNDYESDYATLLKKISTTTIEAKRLRTLAIVTLRTMNNINSSFMKDIFTPTSDPKADLLTSLLNITCLQSMMAEVW